MTMSYQQEFVLNGVAGRAAILNLTARHNRLYSAGDLGGWIATFRHAGATFIRAGETYTDLRKAFDGGERAATGDRRPRDRQSTASMPPSAASRCCSSEPNFAPPASISDRLIYERGGWYFTSRRTRMGRRAE